MSLPLHGISSNILNLSASTTIHHQYTVISPPKSNFHYISNGSNQTDINIEIQPTFIYLNGRGIILPFFSVMSWYSTFIGSLVLTYSSWREQNSEWICFWFTSQKAWLATRMIVVLECRYPLEKIPLISWNRYNSYKILKMINLLLERRIYQSYNRG